MYFGVVKNGVCACVCVCGEEMEGGENLDKITQIEGVGSDRKRKIKRFGG
jgi:hypothetical protein